MNIVRLLKVRNEIDIIEENLEYYANQGIPSIVLDNDSDDGTFEVCKRFEDTGDIVMLDRISTDGFEREKILRRLDQMCEKYSPDVVVMADADEFMESPVLGKSLKDGIDEQFHKGYNLIQMASMEFWMTEKDDPNIPKVMDRIKHYSFFPAQHFRIYGFVSGTSLATFNNHAPDFPNEYGVKLVDDVFITRHYKFRSLEQALGKVRRVVPTAGKKDVGFHYLNFDDKEDNYVIPANQLHFYAEDKNWSFDIVHFGGRMSRDELKQYLGIKTDNEMNQWFRKRNPFYRELPIR